MISISAQLKAACPTLRLGVVRCRVSVNPSGESFWRLVEEISQRLSTRFPNEDLTLTPQLSALRQTYKLLGKDPSRYRGSSEALVRRIVSGKGLYKVNNVVDVNNLLSLETLDPVGTYDLDQIQGNILFGVGQEGETYQGIGKGVINIAGLPVFLDDLGPFGSPTSDSERAMIKDTTKSIMLVVISFSGRTDFDVVLPRASSYLQSFAAATDLEISVVE